MKNGFNTVLYTLYSENGFEFPKKREKYLH